MNLHGSYEIQLIDVETKEVLYSHTQRNLITDYGYRELNRVVTPNYMWLGYIDGDLDSEIDYRKYNTFASMGITDVVGNTNSGAASTSLTTTMSNNDNTKSWEFNYPAPDVDREINVISMGSYSAGSTSLFSFIKLTNAIQQLTTTILYIKYTIDATFIGNADSVGATSNPWVHSKMQQQGDLMQSNDNGGLSEMTYMQVTPYSVDDNTKCTRGQRGNSPQPAISSYYSYQSYIDYWDTDDSTFRRYTTVDIATSQYYGMYNSIASVYRETLTSAVQRPKNPQFKSPIQHGASDTSIMVNSSITPEGYGTLSVTGTPQCDKISKYVDITVKHSGDASNIYQDTVTFDSATNTFTPTTTAITDWDNSTNGSIVRVSFSGTLPTELTEGTVYYLIYNATELKLATTEANAISANAIELSDNGSGEITITRESTALVTAKSVPYYFPTNHSRPMQPAYDTNGDVIKSQYNYTYPFVIWSVLVGDYVYYASFQQDDPTDEPYNSIYRVDSPSSNTNRNNIALCKWKYGTLDSGVAIEYIPSTSSDFIQVGDDLFITTQDGIVIFDTTTDTMSDAISVTGVTNYDALKQDDVTGYLYLMQSDGFTVFDSSEFKADGTVKDTVLFSELPALNDEIQGTASYLGNLNKMADVYDGTIAWSPLGTNYVNILNWDGIGTRTGTGYAYYAKGDSQTYSTPGDINGTFVHKDGTKNVTVCFNRTYSDYAGIYLYEWDGSTTYSCTAVTGSSSSNSEFPSSASNLQTGLPTADEFGNVTIYHGYAYSSKYYKSQYNIYTQERIIGGSNDVSNSIQPSSSTDRNAIMAPMVEAVIDDTLVYLAGTMVIPRKNTSIVDGKIAPTETFDGTPVPLSADTYTALQNNLDFTFQNTAGIASESQFIEGERYTTIIAANDFKTNMDEAQLQLNYFSTDTRNYTDVSYTVGSDTITITEASDRDFRGMLFVTVKISDVEVSDYSTDKTTGVITFDDTSHDTETAEVSYTVVYRR